MDSNNFRKMGQPNLYSKYQTVKINESQFDLPLDIAPDNRYLNWAAPMADGRIGTDYYNNCSKNVPVGQQYPTKAWLQKNGQQIIENSRNNQIPKTYSLDSSVVPPPAQIYNASKNECSLNNTNSPMGIGIERANNTTPDLFGTFSPQGFEKKPQNPMTTHYYEGGRNSVRGTYAALS